MSPSNRPSSAAAAVGWLLALALGAIYTPMGAMGTAGGTSTSRISVASVAMPKAMSIVRSELSPAEFAAPQPAMIALNLRNKDELAARVANGEILSQAEMVARYYPTQETWAKVSSWALSQNLTVDPEDITHMSVLAHGQVSQVANVFETRFARVLGTDGKEYTSAVKTPSMPADLAPLVSGILQLQPHIRPRPAAIYTGIRGLPYYGPQFILDNYYATGVGDGTGQIVAVMACDSPPNQTDLTTFWTNIGSPHTPGDVTIINPLGYAPYNDIPGLTAGYEATADVETVTGLCPGAKVRVYCFVDFGQLAQAVLADLQQHPGIHELSMSFANLESDYASGTLLAYSQYYMALAAQGVTTFAASGDAGSNPIELPGSSSQGYDDSAPTAVNYPASDPYVTGVGGTVLYFQNTNIQQGASTPTGDEYTFSEIAPEVAMSAGATPSWSGTYKINDSIYNGGPENGGGSGGGISAVFARPSWQTEPGVPAGTMRCVPDVAATSGGMGGQLYTFDAAADNCFSGTSESAPIWAGLCAILNQSLQNSGHPPLGLLGPKLYPLAGTGALNYITQGYISYEGSVSTVFNGPVPSGLVDTNGAYDVGPTYDCITGIGTPNIAQIAAALEAPPAGLFVSVVAPLPLAPVINGSAPITLRASATGSPTGYQWELNGVPIAGATGATEIVYPTAANEGVYSVVVTNPAGSASTAAGALSVTTDSWLINLSARAYAETDANQLIAGFVTTGTANKSLLIRGDGPALGGFGITDFLSDPQLTLVSGSTTVATTTSWASSLDAVFAQVGAFSLAPGSHDTALLQPFAPGAYTAQVVSQTTNSGVALAEIYDADAGAPTNRLTNISARAFVGTGSSILVGGFVIGGNTSQTVIIRGDGPSLAGFGLVGALARTTLTLSDSSGTIATNSGWSNAPVSGSAAAGGIVIQPLTAALSAKVGAFALTAGSGDSAVVATLPPGAYTAQVAGTNNSTGIALVEIYELR